ncbi:MAG: YheU family protein [Myxococcota bacterium]|nr:YheU family protein [Myxococcota bacterium]
MEDGEAERSGTVIDPSALSAEALRGLVEEFVTRDGTDYGAVERSVAEKIAQVTAQLGSGEACIVFDEATETANIVLARDLPGA